jgi:DNA-binding response OmpR family regulator
MALKNFSVLESNVGSYSNETQRAGGLSTQTYSAALFEDSVLSYLAEHPHRRMQPEQFEDDDYQIALVPRKNNNDRVLSILRPSPTTDRVLVLPLTWRGLLDRVLRQFNHSSSAEPSTIIRFGEVRVDFLTMEITRSEKPIALTPQAFKLLRFFIQTPERVFSRNELLQGVWGYNNYPSTRTVDNHICVLRRKLEPTPHRPIHFLTVHGMGYKFVP